MNFFTTRIAFIIAISLPGFSVSANTDSFESIRDWHGGRTNKEGCHNETKTRTYHCH